MPLVGLSIHKLADKSDGERVVRHHPLTGERVLVRPETVAADGFDYERMTPEPWPLAGVEIDDPPKECRISTAQVAVGVSEGWISLEGEDRVFRPSGPSANPWGAPPHVFNQAKAIVFHTIHGDIRYVVTHQPDKYVDERVFKPGERESVPEISVKADAKEVTDEIYAGGQTRVDHFYDLKQEG